MKTPALLLALSLFAAFAGCRREDIRECTFAIPGLSESNKTTVAQALSKYAGIAKDSYRWDFAAKTLTLRYDSMQIAQTNIRMAIAERGIEVEFPTNTTGRAGH